jgi:hypothetical protein
MAFALAVAAGAAVIDAQAEVRIRNDTGGSYREYTSKVQGLQASGERVVIDGPCYSACTLHLSLPPGQVCATARGRLGFHAVRDAQFGIPSPGLNEEMLRAYPANVRNWIVRNGGLQLHVIYAPATQFLPSCR